MSEKEINSAETSATDGNQINDSFIRRQKQLTEIVSELTDPSKKEIFPIITGVASLDETTVTLYFPAKAPTSVAEDLLGFVAPAGWDALVVVAEGLAHSETESSKDVIVGYGLGRHGEEVSVLRIEDEEALVSTLPSEGRVLDCCRRVFSLDTPPGKQSTVELIISAWLGRIFVKAARASQDPSLDMQEILQKAEELDMAEDLDDIDDLDWQALAKLHPLISHEDTELLSPEELGKQIRELCVSGSWGKIRQAVAEGEIKHASITAEQAEWMDDAMFSRWCLADFPDSDAVVDSLSGLLPQAVFEELALSLEEHRKSE